MAAEPTTAPPASSRSNKSSLVDYKSRVAANAVNEEGAPAAADSDDSYVSSECSDEDDDDDHDTDSSRSGIDKVEQKRRELARKETAAVFRLRLIVFLVLLLAAIAVSVIVYYITNNAETEEAASQYEGAAEKVLETFINIVGNKLPAVSSLGVATIAHGVDHFRTWPFVTLSSFQQRSATARSQSGALYVHINPIVTDNDRKEWEEVFMYGEDDAYWIQEGLEYQETVGLFDFIEAGPANRNLERLQQQRRQLKEDDQNTNTTLPDDLVISPIWYRDDSAQDAKVVEEAGSGPFLPTWQTSPVFDGGNDLNENILHYNWTAGPYESIISESVVISEFQSAPPGGIDSKDPATSFFSLLLSTAQQERVRYQGDPMSQVFFPIFDSFRDDRSPVAILVAWINWGSYFDHVLPKTLIGIQLVLRDSCGGEYTYIINGQEVTPLSAGDQHNPAFDSMRRTASFDSVSNIADGTKYGLPLNQKGCKIVLDVYPTQEFYNIYYTNTPLIITLSVAIIFVFTAGMFLIYDRLVERRQALVMLKAEQTTAIVSSLFPENVRDRLMADQNGDKSNFVAPHARLKSFLSGTAEDDMGMQPIADLCPHCTVLFADIAGFTAWSSARDPAQVFILLQTVYQAFDALAKRRKVFKVETIGDSYVAVTGLPEPQANHAVIMARFATECRIKMNQLTSELETRLGPDTNDLRMRFGLHSGPVTAGVLRGDRARFQLFGDTVNTASRMESTGIKNKIQCSESTYNLLVSSGKSHWLYPRTDAVKAKGKGYLKTYWLESSPVGSSKRGTSFTPSVSSLNSDLEQLDSSAIGGTMAQNEFQLKQQRLVGWMVDMFQEHIMKVVAHREQKAGSGGYGIALTPKGTPLDEVAAVIVLPRYDAKAFAKAKDHRLVKVNDDVLSQLRVFISIIASTYHQNPFHNFEHACHVTMATNKFIKRIVAPDIGVEDAKKRDIASTLHNYTHGINSDPLTVLAILFSAVIHDADHRGVGNTQLVQEQKEMSTAYGNKSVAEQNSLDIAWDLLMTNEFEELRKCLFAGKSDLERFRQVMVNVVLATDIFDKELNDLRKNRWNKAFSQCDMSSEEKNDLRATIVIEHIIQASDVSHTMQHWHIYRKWNQRLFREMYAAFKAGRMAKDPSSFWYRGELGFFDNYVIPLAKKLRECNVFGVSSDECLNYAVQNRAEWADRGQEMVAEMMNKIADEANCVFPERQIPETTPEQVLLKSHGDDASVVVSELDVSIQEV